MCLKKLFCIIFYLTLFLLNMSNFIFSSEKEKKISIGISSNYWGPKKPHGWGKVGEFATWEELGIKGKFYDKQLIFSLLLEYKLNPKSSLTFSYPVKKYEGSSLLDFSPALGYDDKEVFNLNIFPIIFNYLLYFKEDSSPYIGFGIGLYKVEISLKQIVWTYSATGNFSQNRKGYELVGGYEYKINKNISAGVEVKYRKIEKIKGEMKKVWSTGTVEIIEIDEAYEAGLILPRNNDISGLNYGLKIKYMF